MQLYDNRFQQDQYSFLPFATTTAGLISNPFSAQKDYYITKYPDEGYSSYSISRNTSTSSRFATATFAPGKSQVGQNRASVLSKRTNAANEVRIWDLDASGLPVATGYYAANELFGNESESPTDAQQAYTTKAPKSRIYTDKEGRVILKMVADSNYTYQNSSVTTWQSTYYVYDELGRLCYTLPPKAVALTGSNTGLTSAVLNDLCFQYRYDLKGRPCAIRKPGEDGFTWIVYDRKNRAIMRQTPQEAAAHQWEIGFFDIQDRIKATSLFTDNNAYSQSQWQQQVDTWSGSSTSNLLYHLTTEIGESTVPGENQITGNTMMNYTWYDNYSSSDPTGGFWSTYANTLQLSGDLLSTTGAETPVRSLRTQGMVTGTKTRILPSPHADPSKTGDWKQSAVFYDDKGHIIYSVSYDNYQGNMIHASYAGSQYDFAGRVLITKHIFTNTKSTDATNQHTEWNKNTYDAISGVLVKSLHKVDNGLWVPLSTYTYDDMGQVQREVLGNSGEVRDYRYNIRGS
ncbi:hypothetical protein ACFJIV_28840 [Mucilaginibacter sp. UC70_90]